MIQVPAILTNHSFWVGVIVGAVMMGWLVSWMIGRHT